MDLVNTLYPIANFILDIFSALPVSISSFFNLILGGFAICTLLSMLWRIR